MLASGRTTSRVHVGFGQNNIKGRGLELPNCCAGRPQHAAQTQCVLWPHNARSDLLLQCWMNRRKLHILSWSSRVVLTAHRVQEEGQGVVAGEGRPFPYPEVDAKEYEG
eukprot:scaffold104583_cov19-Tisochrysis_lutea.AAC.1